MDVSNQGDTKMADQKVTLPEIDFSETFQSFFVDTGAIPGTENHQDFLEAEDNVQPVPQRVAYGDEKATGWIDKK